MCFFVVGLFKSIPPDYQIGKNWVKAEIGAGPDFPNFGRERMTLGRRSGRATPSLSLGQLMPKCQPRRIKPTRPGYSHARGEEQTGLLEVLWATIRSACISWRPGRLIAVARRQDGWRRILWAGV